MAKLFPFKGVRYNIDKVGNLSKVITPPYDVISDEAQQRYYEKSPYNIIRLILNKDLPGDSDDNNRYTRARDFFNEWQNDRVLLRDSEDSIYLYEQEFVHKGEKKVRSGIIVLLELSDFAAQEIFPHERTFDKPKIDRFKLMETCETNFSPVFGLYYDNQKEPKQLLSSAKKVENKIIEVTDEFNIAHRVWQVKEKSRIGKITEDIKNKQIFIADGHHRYEAALNFRNHMRKQRPDKYTGAEPYNYVMIYLANLDNEGITILPTYRLIRTLSDEDLQRIIPKIEESFDIRVSENKEEMLSELEKYKDTNRYIFGMYYHNPDTKRGEFHILNLKDAKNLKKVIDKTKPDEYNKLNITVLHRLVIDTILSSNGKVRDYHGNIVYVKSEEEAINLVDQEKCKVAFFLNPTKIDELKSIALAGGLMPQKSTYFYPKLETGLVINKL